MQAHYASHVHGGAAAPLWSRHGTKSRGRELSRVREGGHSQAESGEEDGDEEGQGGATTVNHVPALTRA